MIIIGITGSFGTGKTTVTKCFKQLGAKIIDADRIAHILIKANAPTYKSLIGSFGRDILKNKSQEIDRCKLAKIVFGNKRLLQRLSRILHPAIIQRIKQEVKLIKVRSSRAIIIIDAPLLIEAGLLNLVDKLIVVAADKNTQISRIKKNKGLSKNEIEARINAQLPLSEKIKSADYVVDNSGSLTYTKKQVKEIWDELKGLRSQ